MVGTVTLNDSLRAFIAGQPLFFVATAGAEGRINVSPKGLESLRVLSETRLVWLNLSGSGNETAAHVRENGRMTLMFCAFEGPARILRVYGKAQVVHPRDAAWASLAGLFPVMAGARQVFDFAVQHAQVSCGTGVPVMEYKAQRGPQEMLPFYADMPPGGLEAYWSRKNRFSMDGRATGIFPEDETE